MSSKFHFLVKPYEGPEMADKANYVHICVWFAEGLRALGHPFTANMNYYPDPSGNYLFREYVGNKYEYVITQIPEHFQDELMVAKRNGKKIIIFDDKDEWCRHTSTSLMPICTKYCMTTSKVETQVLKPICFSITQRMIDAFRVIKPFYERKQSICFTHRVSTSASIRTMISKYYNITGIPINTFHDNFSKPTDPIELHWWSVTGRRHSTAYYDFIQSHILMDAHGGYLTPDGSVNQWDSWKFWEGLLAGCAVISADLKYYNIQLPFNLIPFVHYLPVRYDALEESYERIFNLKIHQIAKIAENGRKFVLEKYDPENLVRFLLPKLTN